MSLCAGRCAGRLQSMERMGQWRLPGNRPGGDHAAGHQMGGALLRDAPLADEDQVAAAVGLLAQAKKPVILSGSGVIWSDAAAEFQAWVEASGIPFYTTPQGRGVVPEDHELCFPNARSTALKDADAILVVGTRVNYVFGHMRPPRFRADAKLIRIDVDSAEINGTQRLDVGLIGDARAVLKQHSEAAKGKVQRLLLNLLADTHASSAV